MIKSIPLNIPNALSLYRIIAFPFLILTLIIGYENLFAWLICINLITDILDGLIARTFNMETEIGARLDSIADLGTYIAAISGIFVFKFHAFEPHVLSFSIFIGLFVGSVLLSLIKFGRFSSFHLYSSKIGGYLQGIFFFILFVFDFYTALYYIMISWGIASFIEHISIQLIIKKMRSNVKGLYWILKEKKWSQ